jgi:hypothetical protein
VAAGRWARSYWVCWRNWQKKTAGGGGGRGRWPLARGTGGPRPRPGPPRPRPPHQLFERRGEQGGPINIQAKHALGQVRAASSKARNAPLRIYALPEVFSCQPITCRSSSDGDGNGDGDLAPKMLVHDTKPAKLNTKSDRLVPSLRTKMPPRRILEPSRAQLHRPPNMVCTSCYVLGCQISTYRLENQLPSPLHNRYFCPDLRRRHHSAYGWEAGFYSRRRLMFRTRGPQRKSRSL